MQKMATAGRTGRFGAAIATATLMMTLAACGGESSSSGSTSSATPPTANSPTPPPPSPPPATTGSAELAWSAPTKNEDGSALTNLAGYKVRYGQSAGVLSQVRDIATAATTRVTIEGLSAGTWYFTVASYTNAGVESAPTGAVSKSIP